MAKENLKELLTKKIEKNKESQPQKEGETPSFEEVGFTDKSVDQNSLHWKYLFTMQKSKSKLSISVNGEIKIYNQIKVVSYGDMIEIYTIDYTDIKPIKNTEEIIYSKFDAELLSNPSLENRKKLKTFFTLKSVEIADNKPYILKNIINFLDEIFLDYFNEDKGHLVFIKKSFDSLIHGSHDESKLKAFIYNKLISEGAFRNLNIKLSFNNEPSDLIWSIYEELIADMKEVRNKMHRGNIYFSEQEKEIEQIKQGRLLDHLKRIKDKY